jgi:hypothetical protein
MEKALTIEEIKQSYMAKSQEIARLEKANRALTERVKFLEQRRGLYLAQRLRMIRGEEPTPAQEARFQWWCGLAMGAWIMGIAYCAAITIALGV